MCIRDSHRFDRKPGCVNADHFKTSRNHIAHSCTAEPVSYTHLVAAARTTGVLRLAAGEAFTPAESAALLRSVLGADDPGALWLAGHNITVAAPTISSVPAINDFANICIFILP